MNKREIEDLLNTISDNIPYDENEERCTADGYVYYEIDEDSWQYRTLKYVNNLQQRIDKAIEFVSGLSSKGRDCDIYEDIKQDILSILKGENNES